MSLRTRCCTARYSTNALLDLLQAVMVGVQHVLRLGQIVADAGTFLPGHADQPVDVVANHRSLGGHGRHHPQLVQLGLGLGLGFLGHACLLDLLLELFGLVGHVFQLAQFLLDGLGLLVEIVLALALLHLLFDTIADALLDLEHIDLALDQTHQMLEPLPRTRRSRGCAAFPRFSGTCGRQWCRPAGPARRSRPGRKGSPAESSCSVSRTGRTCS